MPDYTRIETLAQDYRAARDALAGRLAELEDALTAAKRAALPGLRAAVIAASSAREALAEAATADAALWVRPRTRIFHGIKVGLRTLPTTVAIEDEAETIRRIRAQLPPEQAALLIRVRESVDRRGVADLTAADLRRLRIRLEGGGDALVCAPVDGELDKLVDALLGDLRTELEEATR